MLSIVLYYFIDNYVCIDYICCQYKTLSVVCCDSFFENTSYNESLGIGIPEVLMDLISCRGFMMKKFYCHISIPFLVGKLLFSKRFLIILEHNSKHLSGVSNEEKQIIHGINILKTDFVMECYTIISSVENTINKLHIQSNFRSV